MRLRLLLLTENEQGREISSLVQDVLGELTLAFGHTLVIKEDFIGTKSLQRYGSALTQETVDSAADCDAILCFASLENGPYAMAKELQCASGAFVHQYPPVMRGNSLLKSQHMPAGILVFPLEAGQDALSESAAATLKWAKNTELPVAMVPANGDTNMAWQSSLLSLQPDLPETTLPALLAQTVSQVDSPGFVLGSFIVCQAVHALCCAVSGAGPMSYTCFSGTAPVLYQTEVMGEQEDNADPFGALLACTDMLRRSFGLLREADCLAAAVENVLEAGWRTADIAERGSPRIGTAAIGRLICEQIALAGQLMLK